MGDFRTKHISHILGGRRGMGAFMIVGIYSPYEGSKYPR